MSLSITSILMAVAVAGWTPRWPISVGDVLTHRDELHGKIVEVRGWLGTCLGYTCSLYADQRSAVAENRDAPNLVIGPRGNFDQRAGRYRHAEIVLRARFDKTCLIPVCTDRASVLNPIGIAPVQRHRARQQHQQEQ